MLNGEKKEMHPFGEQRNLRLITLQGGGSYFHPGVDQHDQDCLGAGTRGDEIFSQYCDLTIIHNGNR